MTRKDFVERGEVKVDFLKYYRLVSRWACKTQELQIADLELLFYLDPILYFTIDDFKEGTLYYAWDKDRFWRLTREGWIQRSAGREGGKFKYKVSQKGKLLIRRIYKMLIGEEDIPETAKRNKIMKRSSYSDKVYSQAIKAFNKQNRKL